MWICLVGTVNRFPKSLGEEKASFLFLKEKENVKDDFTVFYLKNHTRRNTISETEMLRQVEQVTEVDRLRPGVWPGPPWAEKEEAAKGTKGKANEVGGNQAGPQELNISRE